MLRLHGRDYPSVTDRRNRAGAPGYGEPVRISTCRVALTKRHPLTISRGTVRGSVNVVVRIEHDGIVGWGEMAPSDVTGDTADGAERALAEWTDALRMRAPFELDRIAREVGERVGDRCAATRAALDLACHDWLGRRAGLPLWQLLGVDRTRTPLTSLTIGIDAPDVIRSKVPEILHRTGARILKVKLGQPAGEDADRDMFALVQEVAAASGHEPLWRVDANGGWSTDVARRMIAWLAERGVDMVEQPLVQGAEADLPSLRPAPVPIYADESVRTSRDVAALAPAVDGFNLKLMKCGGLREALRIIHTARAHGKDVMIGCMGESSLAIGAGAQLGGLVDALDLDSHLNLLDDPFEGAPIVDGRVAAGDGPGLGIRWIDEPPAFVIPTAEGAPS